MFGIGGFELFLILLFGFLIFGPDKLPALAKTIGQAIGKFRDAQAEMTEQLRLDELLKQDAAKALAAKGSGQPAKASAAKGSGQAASDAQAGERPLSFSERKARYERERAAAAKGGAEADAVAAAGQEAPAKAVAAADASASDAEGASR